MLKKALLVLGAVLIGTGAHGDDRVRLCTAQPTGTYALAGADIRDAASGLGLEVEPVASEGSMDNLARLASGRCDAAIIQADAYLLYQQVAQGSRVDVEQPTYLYDEVAHLVCHERTGVGSLSALLGADPAVAVAVGDPGSGSALTWGAFATIDPTYAKVVQHELGGAAALEAIASGGPVGCLFHVSAPGSPWLREDVAKAPGLRMVAIDGRGLAGASIGGVGVYTRAEVGPETYPALLGAGPVRTVAVRAVLVAVAAWARENAAARDALGAAVEAARPTIAQRAGRVR